MTGNLEYGQIIEDLESWSKKMGGLFIQSFKKYLLSVTMCQTDFQVFGVHQGTKKMNIPAFVGFPFQG